jgi:periplasmic protein TonB
VTELAIYADRRAAGADIPVPQAPPLRAPIRWDLSGLGVASKADRRILATAVGLAVLAHAAVLYALMREPGEPMAGGGGQQIDTISVTIVSSQVLESIEADRTQPNAPASAASVDINEGVPDSAPAAGAERREEKTEKEEPEKEREKPQEEPVRAVEAIFEVPKEEKRRTEQPAAPAAGGAAARGEAAVPTKATGAAAASAGAVREYARYVSLALSKTKPRASGRFGTVRIKFVIAADGSLASAEIAKSSGNERIDASALEAVRHAKFPTPPSGMSLVQLTYEVPYHFR